jgi:hypothetical protein
MNGALVRQAKPGKGGSHKRKPFVGTLRVTSPVRQSLASSRKRVLRGAGATRAAKRRQRVSGPRHGAPKSFKSREPTSSRRRKAASRRRNGLASAIPPGSENGARSRGSPRNLGGPAISSASPGRRYRVTNSWPVVAAPGGGGSETRVQPGYRQVKATKRGGRDGGESERLRCTDDAGEPSRGTPPREGGAGP